MNILLSLLGILVALFITCAARRVRRFRIEHMPTTELVRRVRWSKYGEPANAYAREYDRRLTDIVRECKP